MSNEAVHDDKTQQQLRMVADVARPVTSMAHSKVELAQEDIAPFAGAEDMCGIPNEGNLNLKIQSFVQALELLGGAKDLDSDKNQQLRTMADVARQFVIMTSMAHSKVEMSQEDIPPHACAKDTGGVPNEGKLNLEMRSSVQALELLGEAKDVDSGEEFQSRQVQDKDTKLGFWARCAPVGRTLSAALYLFDVVSTLVVVKEYFDMDKMFTHRDSGPSSSEYPSGKPNIPWVSVAVVIIIVVAHVANAIAFKLILPPKEQPIRSAYFLPLIQLQRLVSDLWATGTCHRAIVYVSNQRNNIRSYACAMLGGCYTFSVLLVRCFIVALLVNSDYSTGWSGSLAGYVTPALISPMILIFLRASPTMRDSLSTRKAYYYGVRICYAMTFGYVSTIVGPLYPIMNDARARKQLKQQQQKFIIWFIVMVSVHLIIDGIGLALVNSIFYQKKCYNFQNGVCPFIRATLITGICLDIVSIASYYGLVILDQRPLKDVRHDLCNIGALV